MKDKQKSLEIAMEYQIQRDQKLNQYVQLRQANPHLDCRDIGRLIWRLQTLFEGWVDLSNRLTYRGGSK